MDYDQPDPSEGVTPLGSRGNAAYLSPRQFMSMRRVKQLQALDQGAGGPVEDLIPMKRREVEKNRGDTADYPALIETMEQEGPKGTSVPPIYVRNGPPSFFGLQKPTPENPSHDPASLQLGNGGHRVAIAHDLGWKAIRWTGHKMASGYGDPEFRRDSGEDDEDYQSSGSDSSDSSSVAEHSRVPGDRSYMPPQGPIGRNQYTAYSHAKGEAWHRGGGPLATHGLYTNLHGNRNLSPMQFGEVPGQQILPGLGNGVGEYGRQNKSDTSAPHGRWPGGGPILTGDLE